jgi:uncharacterized repeat protein (TIGR01451 family)
MQLSIRAKLQTNLKVIILAGLILSLLPSQPGRAAGNWYVAPAGDDGNTCSGVTHPCGTIQGAVNKAASGDTIYVAAGTYTGNPNINVLEINQDLILSGGWSTDFVTQSGKSTIDGTGSWAGMQVLNSTVTIENFIIENCPGGGIYSSGTITINRSIIRNNMGEQAGGIDNSGNLTLNDSSIINNSQLFYGGIENYGTLTINSSVISGNSALGGPAGSGITNMEGPLRINNSTISNNTGANAAIYSFGPGRKVDIYSSTITDNQGGGIADGGGIFTLQNTILTNNGVVDCIVSTAYGGTVTSLGFNIIGSNEGCTLSDDDITQSDPLLGPLEANGGPTFTRALLEGSPAINAGNPAGCMGSEGALVTDQRGLPRNGRCDIGAYELQPLDFSKMTVSPEEVYPGDIVTYSITLKNWSEVDFHNVILSDTLPELLDYQDDSLTASAGIANFLDGQISWTGDVNSASSIYITFTAMVKREAAYGSVISNTAYINGGGEILPLFAGLRVSLVNVFLPMLSRPTPGIYGQVTLNGVGKQGVPVNLLVIYPDNYYSSIAFAITDLNGSYYFPGLDLLPGTAFQVRFLNSSPSADGRLACWFTRRLTSYTPDQTVYMGTFDLSDVSLVAPGPGSSVSLPTAFQWVKRPATPEDSYQLELYAPHGPGDFFSPLLGYIDTYSLTQLPSGFSTNTQYAWTIWVGAPDGGYGLAYYSYAVAFANRGNAFRGLLPTVPLPNLSEGRDLLTLRWTP